MFGVFKDRWNGFGLNDPDVNFHGLTVSVRLPGVEAVTGPRWSVAADVEDCPNLELVLPARKEAVETTFLDEMREAARLAVYRAMAADPDPRPAYDDWKRAKDAGLRLAPPPAPLPTRPESICISLAVRPAEGPGRVVDLATDLAFAGEAWSWVHDALPLVTADSDLEPYQLAQLLRAGFFSPSDDSDADSWERQRTDFEQDALHIALRLLASDDEAKRTTIADAVSRELFWLIPHNRGADISVRDRKVTVTLATLGPPGTIEVSGGTVRLCFVERAGTVTAEVTDPPPPPANKPVVTVRRRADGAPDVTVQHGKALVRILDD